MSKEIQLSLQKEMERKEELHDKEAKIWQIVQERYDMQLDPVAKKIKQLKTTIQEMWVKVEMNTARIKALLDTIREWFL